MKKINIKITDQPIISEEFLGNEDYMEMLELCKDLALDKSTYSEITIKKAIKTYPNDAAF